MTPKLVTPSSLVAAFVLIAGITGSAEVLAEEERGAYIGANFGFTRLDSGTTAQEIANEVVALGFSSATVTIDESSTGFKILGGYQINPNFAVEGYYTDLGEYDITVGTTGPAASVTGKAEVDGVGIDVLGMIPFDSRLSGFARIGLLRWDSEVTASGPGGTASVSDDGTDFKFGLGVQWKIAPNVRVRGEWEYYNFENAVSVLSLGLLYRF